MRKISTVSFFIVAAIALNCLFACAPSAEDNSTKAANTPPATTNNSGMTATEESSVQSNVPSNAGDGGGLGK
ncbi:MAG: hypothetical protein ACKVQS_11935 [Fimbriimonadaceae bacterium]